MVDVLYDQYKKKTAKLYNCTEVDILFIQHLTEENVILFLNLKKK